MRSLMIAVLIAASAFAAVACDPIVECPEPDASYGCSDGTCVANPNQCPIDIGCTVQLPVRCSDGTCAMDRFSCFDDCSPGDVLCGDGTCAPTVHGCPAPQPSATPTQTPIPI